MEKLLTITLVMALCLTMLLPFGVHAEEDTLKGTWLFTDTLPQLRKDYDLGGSFPLNFEMNGKTYNRFECSWNGNYSIRLMAYYSSTGFDIVYVWQDLSGSGQTGWQNSAYKTITVLDEPTNTKTIEWLTTNATKKQCDGSMCPSSDLDFDNVCDDCGGILTYNLRSDLYAYAVNVVSRGQELFNADYWLITTDAGESDGYRIFVSTHPFSYDRTTEKLTSTGTVQYVRVYTDTNGTNAGGTGWAAKSAGTSLDYGSPVEVSHDISGFFPVPLWVTVEGATQREIPNLTQTTAGTILTLTLCGVGLMALLVVFVLFGKVFRTYRS